MFAPFVALPEVYSFWRRPRLCVSKNPGGGVDMNHPLGKV